jgi:hypothetical protein
MLKVWGHARVSSALEVYDLLANPPHDPNARRLWHDLLSIEPPVWGSREARRQALALISDSRCVWSWDDYAVVFSPSHAIPPEGLHYRPWHLLSPADHEPSSEAERFSRSA